MKNVRNLLTVLGAGLCAFQVGGCSVMDITELFSSVLGG
jgi:hypothetical protein